MSTDHSIAVPFDAPKTSSNATQPWAGLEPFALPVPRHQRAKRSAEVLQAALAQLDDLQSLLPNWDSYGGEPPTGRALAMARFIVRDVQRNLGRYCGGDTEPEYIAPRADGGLQIEWGDSPTKVSVSVDADGRLGYLYVDRTSGERRSEERHDVAWPDLMQLIAQVLLAVTDERGN